MTLTDALQKYVHSTVCSRGLSYYRSSRVLIREMDKDTVLAIVRGSARYDVNIELLGEKLSVYCDCPYFKGADSTCKHIWATLLTAEKRGFAAGVDVQRLRIESEYDSEPVEHGMPSHAQSRSLPAAPTPDEWEQALVKLKQLTQPPKPFTSSTRPVERQLLFVVDKATCEQHQKLALELLLQERKMNGEWSLPKANRIPASEQHTLVEPVDRQILSLLGGAESADYYGYNIHDTGTRFRLTGLVLETFLPILATTTRVRLRNHLHTPADLQDLIPDLDEPWTLTTHVAHSENRKQFVLSGQLRRGSETMPLSKPTVLVPGFIVWDGRFGRFDDGGAASWVPTLRRVGPIAVPVEKADELLNQLLSMPNLPRLELPQELEYREESFPPRPRLVVKQSPAKHHREPVLLTELSFEYDDAVAPYLPPSRGIYKQETRRFLLRNPIAEQSAEQELIRLGMRYENSYGLSNAFIKAAQLPKLVRVLVLAGWKVEAEGKLYRQASKFDLSVKSGQDWFDLDATADFDGRTVTFPRLLEALRRGDSSIVLDDGSLGMVPEEWLKKYGLLAQMGTVEGDSVRFSRAQVGVLDALLASRPEVTFDKQFARARDELRKFQGVAAADPPKQFQGELREYQREGLGWLRFLRKFGFGGCLADDMGLGKTVQVLALLAGKRNGPALVVVPKSLIFNWKQEAARFAPKLTVLDHTGTARDKTGAEFKNADIILTTYGTLRKDAALFAEQRFDTCVLDESQSAKNAETETAKAVRLIQADHRLALSGTPVENHLGELWTLFDFLNPGMLGRAALFSGGMGSLRNPDAETKELLAKALRPFILRRTKAQVAKDLPEKTEQTVYCDLEPAQRQMYDELREHYRNSLLNRVASVGLARSKFQVLEALLRLRQAACHPGLIDKKRTAESSAKLEVLLPQLQELAESGCKVLVFSQFTSLLAIVRKRLDDAGVIYEYLDGKTRDRAERVERFQTDADCKLFLISLKAGGVGLNLTAAEYVFLLDPWWNPAVEAQAIDRSHRIGQTKPVFAYRLIARGTVEEKVLALQQSKRDLADSILSGDGRFITDLKREDLELLLS